MSVATNSTRNVVSPHSNPVRLFQDCAMDPTKAPIASIAARAQHISISCHHLSDWSPMPTVLSPLITRQGVLLLAHLLSRSEACRAWRCSAPGMARRAPPRQPSAMVPCCHVVPSEAPALHACLTHPCATVTI
jgi:hypothetical protein